VKTGRLISEDEALRARVSA